MNKNAIKKFAIDARNKLIASVTDKAGMLGITKDACSEPITKGMDFEVYKTTAGTEVTLNKKQCEHRRKLVEQIKARGFDAVIEEVAYTWFNRICAIRFMEVNDYMYPARVRVLSSEKAGKNEPDILTLAPDIDWEFTEEEREYIIDAKMNNKLDDLFRMLFIKQCNLLHEVLPGLFEETEDYTEMLLNISFTNEDDVIRMLIDSLDEADFNVSTLDENGNPTGQVEIIGWLYQYYNTELKDDTFAKLKKNVKITKERIPAATQLFTPDWIVRYMVENSVGRIWIEHLRANDPSVDEKATAERFGWKYYLPEAEQEADVNVKLAEIRTTYKDLKPTDITCIDPCMGSGHILIAMFDVLMDIYESTGYDKREAAFDIVEHNIHGLDIDKRAYQLAYFAVMMKGRGYNRRFFRGRDDVKPAPKVYAIMESNDIEKNHLQFFGTSMPESERTKAVEQVRYLLHTFVDAREYGSILNVDACDWKLLDRLVNDLNDNGQVTFESLGSGETQKKLQRLIKIAEVMSKKYDAVVTNPPYMGGSGMNAKLSDYVKKYYPDSKGDLFACCIEKGNNWIKAAGYNCMVTMQSWMFLSSFEKMRINALNTRDITNLMHMENMVMGIAFGTAVTIFRNSRIYGYKGTYNQIKLCDIKNDKPIEFPIENNNYKHVKTENFERISGSPIACWASDELLNAFNNVKIDEMADVKTGLQTGNNNKYLRFWFEVSDEDIDFKASQDSEFIKKWYLHTKGGNFRKWYGNYEYIINWKDNGLKIKQEKGAVIRSPQMYFKEGITWSHTTSGGFSGRILPCHFIINVESPSIFNCQNQLYVLAVLNSAVGDLLFETMNSTMHYLVGNVAKIPIISSNSYLNEIEKTVKDCIALSNSDWDSFETSWDFKQHPFMPQEEEEGITVLAGMKVGEEIWIKKLLNGSACFSPVADFIEKGENENNNEQGDKYEGVFARLKKNDSRISLMEEKLRNDLEKIEDGDYILLRRKSSRTIPVFCLYGFYKEDAKIIEQSSNIIRLKLVPSPKMYHEFLNGIDSEQENKTAWTLFFSLGHLQNNIQNALDDEHVNYKFTKVKYDLFDENEFFIEPTNDYSELAHKAKRLSYQKEIRWILSDIHQKTKYILPYSPLEKESIGCHEGMSNFQFEVMAHPKEKVSIESCYNRWKYECDNRFNQLKANEEELNRIFIDIYGLQGELTPKVEDKDVTVRKADLQRDVRSFMSYAVGCMLGRYSLDVDGLVFAGGEWNNSKYQSYIPDADNIIPITDEEYFSDDIVGRFVEFVKTVYGEDTLEENLDFIAQALGNRGDASREVIRNYFIKDFYADHLKVYQKRPIYWLFDSGKQNGFKALIYMHRYDADTVGRVRTDYLHKAQKYVETAMQSAQYTLDNASSSLEKSKATKSITKYTKQLAEMRIYDEAIAHIANQRIEIDLDDGVKVNYAKFQGVEVAQEGKKALKVDLLAKI